MRENPSLVPAAFNEVLRYWGPIHAFGRLVTRDVELDGVLVPEGAKVAILFNSGNRDPRHYPDADAFLVERNPIDHLSFGYGPHGCAGQAWPGWRPTRSSKPWRAASSGSSSAPRSGCRATPSGASKSSPSWR